MLKWFAKVACLFVIAALVLNIVVITLVGGSFELTTRNWSVAISVSLVGIVATAAAAAFSLRRSKPR